MLTLWISTMNHDMLQTGPDLLANLLGIILRFREKKISTFADFETMYMQISVHPAERKFLRFLWGETEPHFFEYLRFLFGAKCSPTCANFALQTWADNHFNEYPYVKRIVRGHFSTDTIQEAISIFHDLRLVLSRRGFNLTKCILNDIPSDHLALSRDEIRHAPKPQKVHGLD